MRTVNNWPDLDYNGRIDVEFDPLKIFYSLFFFSGIPNILTSLKLGNSMYFQF